MIDIDYVVKEVSKKTGINQEIVENVCKHVFKFTTEVMKDDNDCHDILFRKLFRFKLKSRFRTNKTNKYSPYE